MTPGLNPFIMVDLLIGYSNLISLIGFFFVTAESVSSWNITVGDITSSSAKVSWTNFPLLLSVNYYLVRYKEVSNGVSRLYHVSRFSNTYYTNMLKAYQAYDVQVFAVAENDVTYASKAVSLQTEEGGKSVRRSSVYSPYQGLTEAVATYKYWREISFDQRHLLL